LILDEYEDYEEKYFLPNKFLPTEGIKMLQSVPFINYQVDGGTSTYLDAKSLPKFSDSIYKEIENFPDFDYTNSVAYEMLIRTKEFKQLHSASSFANKKEFDKLGIDLKEFHDFNLMRVSSYYGSKMSDKKFGLSYIDLTIKDIDNGIEKLISFYIEKTKVYKLIKSKKKMEDSTLNCDFKIDKTATFDQVMTSPSIYHIPLKYDYQNNNRKFNLMQINGDIPLQAFEDDFLYYIKQDIPNDIKGKVALFFTRPQLRFKESAMIDVPINFNLSKSAIIEIVSKLKDEYDDESLKAPIYYLYNQRFQTEDWRGHAPFKVTKKSIAKAFFVYDLYVSIDSVFERKKFLLKKSMENSIMKLKKDTFRKIKQKKHETAKLIKQLSMNLSNREKKKRTIIADNKKAIKKIEKDEQDAIKRLQKAYKIKCQDYNTYDVVMRLTKVYEVNDENQNNKNGNDEKNKIKSDKEMQSDDMIKQYRDDNKNDQINISNYMVFKYLQFMRQYIDDKQYKKLIIGTEEASK